MGDFELFSYVNGQPASALSIADRGLAYGDGLFETMRLEGGRIPLWPLHFDRLSQSCTRLRIPLDTNRLQRELDGLLEEASARSITKGVLKLIVTRGAGGRGYCGGSDLSPNHVISLSPLPSFPLEFLEEGVRVYLCRHRLPDNPLLAGIKHLNKLDYVMACQEWSDGEFQEGLLLNRAGKLVEACSRNVFVVRGGMLFTPHLEAAGVAGVLRRRIMENYAAEVGVSIEESCIDFEFLSGADEVFLTNSVTGVWPVRTLIGEEGGELNFTSMAIAQRMQQLFAADLDEGAGVHDA